MDHATAFLEVDRRDRALAPPPERLRHWDEFVQVPPAAEVSRQASRCMDCGIPFCHNACPVNNLIPDWNDLVTADDWRGALARLHATNNFPEFTGRICPAPCEAACTLNLLDAPVTIKSIECEIVDRGWCEGWVEPVRAPRCTSSESSSGRARAAELTETLSAPASSTAWASATYLIPPPIVNGTKTLSAVRRASSTIAVTVSVLRLIGV